MKELFYSTKFRVALIATIVAVGAKFGLQLDDGTVAVLISPMMLYIGSHAYVSSKVTPAVIAQETQEQAHKEQQATAIKIAAINNADTKDSTVEQIIDSTKK